MPNRLLPEESMATATTERECLSAYREARATVEGAPLDPDELRLIDAYWRASLYLCLGMIYLKDNPLLREPLTLDHLKVRLLGHWGSPLRPAIARPRGGTQACSK
jgi:xylulose-5-phosphate/fructose-6-phosphate phosphoketolase